MMHDLFKESIEAKIEKGKKIVIEDIRQDSVISEHFVITYYLESQKKLNYTERKYKTQQVTLWSLLTFMNEKFQKLNSRINKLESKDFPE